jgi:drug/metabolite transporter, DME family
MSPQPAVPRAAAAPPAAADSGPASAGAPPRPAGLDRAAVATACGSFIWGTLGPVVALFPAARILQVAELRLLIGAAALSLLARLRGRHRERWHRRERAAVAVGSVAVAGFSVCYFYAVERSGVATSTVIAVGGAPVLAGITARFLTRRNVTRTWVVATAVAVTGMALVALPGAAAGFSWPGAALATTAAALYAAQADMIQIVARRHGPVPAVAAIFTGGALALTPWLPSALTSIATSAEKLAGVFYLGVFTTAVAYALFAYGVDHLGAPTAVTISLLEPATAAVLAAVLLKQDLSALRWAGLVLVLGGLALMMRPQRPARPTA